MESGEESRENRVNKGSTAGVNSGVPELRSVDVIFSQSCFALPPLRVAFVCALWSIQIFGPWSLEEPRRRPAASIGSRLMEPRMW
jgi:hypothetical protein